MAKTPHHAGTVPVEDSSAAAPAETTSPPGLPPRTPVSTRSRWLLSSIAGVGVLSLGLLGGILIGQQMVPPGMHNGNNPSIVFMGQGGTGHNPQLPDTLRDRMKDHIQEQWQQRRDQRRNLGEISPSPTAPDSPGSPDSGLPHDGQSENNG